MTPEAQRIAIAEACGWKRHPLQMNKNFWIHFPSEKQARDDSTLPDYPNDLNAMHEAEKIMCGNDWKNYIMALHLVTNSNPNGNVGEVFKIATATASQRAEAFLKALNLWKP